MSELLDIVLPTLCHLHTNQNEKNEHEHTVFWCVHEQPQERISLHADVVKDALVLRLKPHDKLCFLDRDDYLEDY